MVLCHSKNAGWVMRIPWGGEDTQTIPCKPICLNFLQSVVVGSQNLQAQMLTPSLAPKPPGESFTDYFWLWWCLLHYMILSSDYHLSATTASLYCPAVANFLSQNNDHQTEWQIQEFPELEPTSKIGLKTYNFGHFTLKTTLNWKQNWTKRGRASLAPLGSINESYILQYLC